MQRTVLKQRLCAAQNVARRSPGVALRGLHSLLRLTAVFALLLGSCAKDPVGPGGPDEGTDLALYIPAPERVETYSGATIDECRIDNAVVLAWNKTNDEITGAEVVATVMGNGTQQPTLRFRKLKPQNGETIVVLCNLDPTTVNQAEGLVGQNMAAAQSTLKPRSAAGGTSADMKAPLTMAGEAVWNGQNVQVRMSFQCAKISVVLDPSLTQTGGPLAWTAVRSTYLDHMPATTQWTTASTPASQNEQGTLSQSGTPGYDPDADPMSFPALYTYEAAQPANWPTNRAFNYVLLRVAETESGPMQYYCLTYDQTEQGKITAYRPFERGKHYVFRVKDIYKRGYDNIEEALDNPSNAVYEIGILDDWSKNWEYNGQYGVTADRDTAYVWTTADAQPLYRFSWPQPEGDPDGAPATSTVTLLKADRSAPVVTSLVQLLDKDGNDIPNNTFTFNNQSSLEEGYMLHFKTGNNATAQGLWLHVKCGNIERFVPVGWATLTVHDVTGYQIGGSFSQRVSSNVVMPDGTSKELAWEAGFVDKDGVGTSQPDWITVEETSFPDGSGDFSIAFEPMPLTKTEDPYNERLNGRALVGTSTEPGEYVIGKRYDLSRDHSQDLATRETANSYIVSAPGYYCIPYAYGNSLIGSCTDIPYENTISYNRDPKNENGSNFTTTATRLGWFLDYDNRRIHSGWIQKDLKDNDTHQVALTGTDPARSNGHPTRVGVLWQDNPNMISRMFFATDPDCYICFDVPKNTDLKTPMQGNVVFAAYDHNDKIIWTWHVWITDYDPEEAPAVQDTYSPYDPIRDCKITNAAGQEFILQGQNLGWCSGDVDVYEGRSAIVRITQASGLTREITLEQPRVEIESSGNNPFYQWGRKDPIPAAVNQNGGIKNKTVYDGNNNELSNAFQTSSARYTIGQAIQNPNSFVCGAISNWIVAANGTAQNYCNLWNARLTSSSGSAIGADYKFAKTIYDPCPRGYRVPDPDVFTGMTVDGGTYTQPLGNNSYFGTVYNSPFTDNSGPRSIYGWVFYANPMSERGAYDPSGGVYYLRAGGHRQNSTLVPDAVGRVSYYWTCMPGSTSASGQQDKAYTPTLRIDNGSIATTVMPVNATAQSKTFGYAIRCIRDNVRK